ncbi:MAG: rod shape-determining protein MreC [Terriglobia bacterium]
MHAFLRRHVPLIVLIAVLVAQLVLLAFQVTRKHNVRLIKVWAVAAFDPFERSVRGLTDATTGTLHSYGGLWSAQQENSELRRQLAEAQAQILSLSEAKTENDRLRTLLDLRHRLPLKTVAATVIAASPGTGSAVFIDKGAAENIAADLPVITPGGIVGKTVAVFRHTTQVLLITDRTSGVGALLQQSQVEGVVKGGGDGLCQLAYIMNEESVAPGQPVVTSGLDQIYPKGLLVGTVVRVSNGNIYKNITVKPAAALDRLEDVLVVLKPFTAKSEPSKIHNGQ